MGMGTGRWRRAKPGRIFYERGGAGRRGGEGGWGVGRRGGGFARVWQEGIILMEEVAFVHRDRRDLGMGD